MKKALSKFVLLIAVVALAAVAAYVFVMNKGTDVGGQTNTTALQNQTEESAVNVGITETQTETAQTQG